MFISQGRPKTALDTMAGSWTDAPTVSGGTSPVDTRLLDFRYPALGDSMLLLLNSRVCGTSFWQPQQTNPGTASPLYDGGAGDP